MNGKKTFQSKMTKRLISQYVLVLVDFIGGFIILVLTAWWICAQKTWYYGTAWWILSSIRDNIVLIGVVVCFIGWLVITYYFLAKPLKYLDEVVLASTQLAELSEEPIKLSEELKSVEDEMNMVRETALLNARHAKEAEQRKNDLIVYLAHDLKTPLTSVIGYLMLLSDETDIPDNLRMKYTGIALNKAERLEDLINEFFEITRFNLTSMEMDMETIHLTMMLEQITSEFEPVLREKQLTFQCDFEQDVDLLCDADKMSRVFDNLIRNAVNYSYPSSAIHILLKQEEENVVIKVSNHGKTIAPEKISRIFEQFFRLDSARSSYTGGSGLGLAIAREIIELHKGTITAESENESITFTITLPRNIVPVKS